MTDAGDDRLDPEVTLFALVGSYRSESVNQAVLATILDLAPAEVSIESLDLRKVPFYDGDLERNGPPEVVAELNRGIRRADGIVVVSPEYNSSPPAVLKNAIDWASRGYPDAPISGKLAALFGASPGRGGTASAQQHLRQILARVRAVVVETPAVELARANQLVDDGIVTDPEARAAIDALLGELLDAVRISRTCRSISAVG